MHLSNSIIASCRQICRRKEWVYRMRPLISYSWTQIRPCGKAIQAGLRYGDKGTHTSRTIMFHELRDLLTVVPETASRNDYASAIIENNVLGKQTVSTRRLTNQRMGELYGLDPQIPIFRVLRRLWEIDEAGRPLLALLCALARDPLLRATAPTILSLEVGQELVRLTFLEAIKQFTGDRLNESILDKVARNAGSSWTQSGHLVGRVRKIRKKVEPTPGAVAFALWLGSLYSLSGEELLSTPWTSVFDQTPEILLDTVLRAKQMRLLHARVGGGVVEIDPIAVDPLEEVR